MTCPHATFCSSFGAPYVNVNDPICYFDAPPRDAPWESLASCAQVPPQNSLRRLCACALAPPSSPPASPPPPSLPLRPINIAQQTAGNCAFPLTEDEC